MTFQELLAARGRTSSQAAREMGVHVSTVCRWERRETNPEGENLKKMLQWAAGAMSLADALANKAPANAAADTDQ